MTPRSPTRLYAYVDESGQETAGRLFVVSVLVSGPERETLLTQLEAIEAQSGKGRVKWHKARFSARQAYMLAVGQLILLAHSLFVARFTHSREYTHLTAAATAEAVRQKAPPPYKLTVFVDGLRKHETAGFRQALRALQVQAHKVRGVRRDENDALIRLVDALCGMVRDADEGQVWAATMLTRWQHHGLVTFV